MGHQRARARSKHVAQPPPKRRPLAHHTRVAIACLAVIAIAVPAAAVASQSAGPSTHHSARAGTQHHGRAHHTHAWWVHAWRWHRHHTGHGHSGPIVPNVPEPSVPSTTDPTTTDPTTTDPTTTSPTTTDPTTTSPTTTDPTTTSPPPTGNGQILLGAAGDADGLSAKIGHPLAQHHYADFSQAVPDTDMVTASSSGTWGQVAAMQPGSKMYQDVVRWANELKSRKGTTLFSYSHEPEQSSRTSKGGAGDFVRAYRKVVSVMRAQGATNVLYVWQLTGWAFKSNSKDRMSAHSWYPGDEYVDVVGADEYNWYTCGEGSGKWTPLSDLVAPALAFAKDHGKKFALPEFGAHQDSKRSAWIRAAGDYLAANKDSIVAVFYFQHPPTNSGNMDCRWGLTSGSEYSAYGDLAEDPAFRT